VLAAVRAVTPGQTITYADLAAASGHPRAIRAAAHVCAMNPVPLVIGCHRVVRSDGTIGDYRGGTALKSYLLRREELVTAR
jgi:methylated-DNA-[protein]-cysteine S-methyltransferase